VTGIELHPALAAAMARRRDALNARWELAHPGDHDADAGNAALDAFARVATALFEADSVATDRDSAGARADAWLDDAFGLAIQAASGSGAAAGLAATLAAAEPRTFREAPRAFLASIAICCENVASLGVQAARWAALAARAAPSIGSIDDLRAALCVAAWLSGLVEYRAASIEAMKASPGYARSMLAPEAPIGDAEAALRLSADPWLSAKDAFLPDLAQASRRWSGCSGGHLNSGGPFAGFPLLESSGGFAYAVDRGRAEGDPSRRRMLIAHPEGIRLVSELADLPACGPARRCGLAEGRFAPEDLRPGGPVGIAGGPLAPRADALPGAKAIALGATALCTSSRSYRVFVEGYRT
jgi:hypothetical protein